MAYTAQQVIDEACFLAGTDGINKDTVADILLPRTMYFVARQAAADPNRRQLVMVTSAVTITAGVGALPATALAEHIQHAALEKSGAATSAKLYRYVADWQEFVRPLDTTMGYFTVKQASNANQLYVIDIGATLATTSITANITIPTVPAIPATAATTIDCNGEILNDIIVMLAAAIKGNWSDAIKGASK